MSNDDSRETEILSTTNNIMDSVSEDAVSEMASADKSILYYVAGFVSKSIIKHCKCTECGNVLGSKNDEILILADSLPLECKEFLDSINREGLIKPSDILYMACIGAWETYKLVMKNIESKMEFLASKNHRSVFHACYITYLKSHDKFGEIFNFKCLKDHSFEKFWRNG